MHNRQCRDCGKWYDIDELRDEPSELQPVKWDRCPECNAFVYAVKTHEETFLIAKEADSLRDMDGDSLSVGQCDSCGGVDFVLDGKRVRCMNTDCHAEYPVQLYRAYSVVFP